MPAMLLRDHIFASPQRFDWRKVDGLPSLVVMPQPGIDDLEQFSFSPDDLADQGHDVPEGEDEALEYAVSVFREAPEFRDWREAFLPAMAVLWPCQVKVSVEEAAEAMRRESLACAILKGEINGTEVSGIVLTGGGMDLSDHIAAAYVLCGQIPPVTVLESALRQPSPRMEKELVEAAGFAAAALEHSASEVRVLLESRAGLSPRP